MDSISTTASQWQPDEDEDEDEDVYPWIGDIRPPGFRMSHAIGVVNLARLTHTHSILPVALAQCALLSEELYNGLEREDGTRETLGADDAKRVCMGRSLLVQSLYQAWERVFSQIHTEIRYQLCFNCIALCRQTWKRASAQPLHPLDTWPRLAKWTLPQWSPQADGGYCAPCSDLLTSQAKEERKRLHLKLPEIMGLKVVNQA
ncbi:hypothetical protein FKP32DRAFT_1594026 [Trametes sanguinea]|nr:hypothetical protein FKP32DRAFT_1594026 [Trametes sanguinea]